MRDHPPSPDRPDFRTALRFWLKLGFISFGGPAGQIAIMHTELVERRRWISEDRFLHALNYCMLLPGPEAQQLAIYLGWLLHRTRGGIAAGVLFVLPSAVLLWLLAWIYCVFGNVAPVAAALDGLKPAVLAIVAAAGLRLGRKALRNEVMWTLAALAFVAICFLRLPFPVIICAAGLIGFIGGELRRDKFLVLAGAPGRDAGSVPDSGDAVSARPSLLRSVKVLIICLALWWLPVALVGKGLGTGHTVFAEGVFFSQAALVTFGGAYAVLPYVAQRAVEDFGWLAPAQMLDGLGLAETTPGPLIMVVQFVGFVGAWQHPGSLPPLLAATLGAALTTWVTFVPCFLWIFLGAPHLERLRGNARLTCALSSVTAAVVGVVLNLAVWFGRHVLWPEAGGVNGPAVAIAILAFIGIHRWNWGIIPVVLGGGAAGWLGLVVGL